MPKRTLGFNNRAFNLPENEIPPSCEDGGIWTNLTTEEILICLGQTAYTIPHSGYERCSLTKSADQTIVAGSTWTDISFDQEVFDEGDMHDIVTNNERVIAKRKGVYFVFFSIEWEVKKDKIHAARIEKNGSVGLPEFKFIPKVDDCCETIGGTIFIALEANDYIVLQGYHESSNRPAKKENTFLQVKLAHTLL